MQKRWALYWTGWLLFLIISFAVGEGIALATDGTTLSQYVWTLSDHWRLLPWVCGVIVGVLACHFWWRNATR